MIANGVDIVSIRRVEEACNRSGDAFWRRVLSEEERAIIPTHEKRKVEFLAGRFAAKEAVSKALGTGIGGEGVAMTDMKILKKENGAPYVLLSGRAKEVYERYQGRSISISISHDEGMAVAFCCIEWEKAEGEA